MKAYLGWPVFIQGPRHTVASHVTLKYIGEEEFSLLKLIGALEGLTTKLDLSHAYWDPEIWCAEGQPERYVMVLGGLNPETELTRKLVDNLRKDDYPVWRPHVSVSREVFEYLRDRQISPQDGVTGVGALFLFLNREPVYMFGPKQ